MDLPIDLPAGQWNFSCRSRIRNIQLLQIFICQANGKTMKVFLYMGDAPGFRDGYNTRTTYL